MFLLLIPQVLLKGLPFYLSLIFVQPMVDIVKNRNNIDLLNQLQQLMCPYLCRLNKALFSSFSTQLDFCHQEVVTLVDVLASSALLDMKTKLQPRHRSNLISYQMQVEKIQMLTFALYIWQLSICWTEVSGRSNSHVEDTAVIMTKLASVECIKSSENHLIAQLIREHDYDIERMIQNISNFVLKLLHKVDHENHSCFN